MKEEGDESVKKKRVREISQVCLCLSLSLMLACITHSHTHSMIFARDADADEESDDQKLLFLSLLSFLPSYASDAFLSLCLNHV